MKPGQSVSGSPPVNAKDLVSGSTSGSARSADRPLTSNTRETASARNGSAASPYRVSVGIATTPRLEIVFDTVKSSRKYPNLVARHACSFVIGWAGEQTVQFEGQAEQLASSMDLNRLLRDRGQYRPLPSVEEALAYPYTESERAAIARTRSRLFVGSPATLMAKLQPMIAASKADELMIITAVYDHDARKKSYSLLADAFGLEKKRAA